MSKVYSIPRMSKFMGESESVVVSGEAKVFSFVAVLEVAYICSNSMPP